MKRILTILTILLCSWAAQAQSPVLKVEDKTIFLDKNTNYRLVPEGFENLKIFKENTLLHTFALPVEVEATIHVAVTGISLRQTLQLAVGYSQTLIPDIQPNNASNKNLSWESSNTDVATVDAEGNVSAIAKGNSQIIVTTEEGNYRSICNLNVVEPISQFEKDGIYYVAEDPGSTNVLVTHKKYGGFYSDGSAKNSYSGEVIIPAVVEYDGVEYTVTGIDFLAFDSSVNLQSVSLPEGIKSIEARAFENCSNLLTLHLPASLYNIDYRAFAGCKNLTINVANESPYFFTEDKILYEYGRYEEFVLNWIPENISGEYTIIDQTGIIGGEAIYNTILTKLSIPASVWFIRGHNFHYSYNLKTIEFNWDVEGLEALIYENPPATFYFRDLVYSEITLLVPKGTKAAYEAHELWGMGFKIVEKE